MRFFLRLVFGLILLGAGLWLYRQSQEGGPITLNLPQWGQSAPAEDNPYAHLDNSSPAVEDASAAPADPYAELGNSDSAPEPQKPQAPKPQPEAPALTGTTPRVPPPSGAQAEAPVTFSGPLPRSADGWYALGVQLREAGDPRRAARAFAQAAALNPSAANWRALADVQVSLSDCAAATRAYDRAAAKYRQGGDDMTARALEHLAAPFRQTVEVRRIVPKAGATQPTLARLEPPRRLALGVYVGNDGVQGAWGQPAQIAPKLRPFAVAFRYWKFTTSGEAAQIFPGRFAQAARDSGMALHLALEPGMPLAQLSDGVIRAFAREAKAAGLPIFVRFASEMNDPQNDWGRDPALYRRTFARVATILHAEAPNVALVWMPMPGDLATIAQYYPGPAAVDWAGLSLYSVPFENGDPQKSRLTAHPLDVLDGFYRQYAPRHPIQLSEYAASSRSGAAPNQDFSAFAAAQMREVYWGAWLKYPRLKNVNWLDVDMHTGDHNGKAQARRNDYRLFANDAKWQTFGAVSAFPAFAQSWEAARCVECEVPTSRAWGSESAGQSLDGALWLTTAKPIGGVKLTVDGQNVPTEQTLPHRFRLPPLSAGKHTLRVLVWDEQSRELVREERVFAAK